MNESNDMQEAAGGSGSEVAGLLRLAGPRARPDALIEQEVRKRIEREWRLSVQRSRHSRMRRGSLAAALVMLSVGIGWLSWHSIRDSRPQWVATVVSTHGPVQIVPASQHALSTSGDALMPGTRIETGVSGGALLSLGSVGVRLGANSMLELPKGGAVILRRGQLYIDDNGHGARGDALVVETEFGSVSHHGTQYQIQAEPGRFLFAAVREGRVEIRSGSQTVDLIKGEGVRVNAAHQVSRESLAPYSEAWLWVSEYGPEAAIDGRPLSAFLDWYARETGLTLIFAAPASREDADKTLLSGSIAGLSAAQALQAVLSTTHFVSDLATPGELRILVRPAIARIEANGRTTPLHQTAR